MRHIRTGIAVSVAAMGLVAANASAGGNTEVTIKANGGDFSGKVKSQESNCKADRKVTVLKKRPGKDEKIGSDTTESDGRWNTGNSGQNSGKFYAKVKARDNCDSAKSPTVQL